MLDPAAAYRTDGNVAGSEGQGPDDSVAVGNTALDHAVDSNAAAMDLTLMVAVMGVAVVDVAVPRKVAARNAAGLVDVCLPRGNADAPFGAVAVVGAVDVARVADAAADAVLGVGVMLACETAAVVQTPAKKAMLDSVLIDSVVAGVGVAGIRVENALTNHDAVTYAGVVVGVVAGHAAAI